MTTCVFYIDESGNKAGFDVPLKKGQTPLFVLSGVALALEDWRGFDREYLYLKNNFFKNEIKYKNKRAEKYEIKGSHLISPTNRKDKRRRAFLNEVLNLIFTYNGQSFYCATIKDPKSPMGQIALYTHSLQILIEKFNCYIEESLVFTNAIMILDNSSIFFDNKVAQSHASFIFGNPTGRRFTNIVEAPLFADSKLTSGLQIVDNMSALFYGIVYERKIKEEYKAHSYSHLDELKAKTYGLGFKSKETYKGYQIFGHNIIDHNKNKD